MEQIVVVGADPVLDLVRAAPFAFQWEFALNVYRDNGGPRPIVMITTFTL
ncbi:hypothetical protein LCGC14_0084550 [marine sediment metagenome]|uniref:Uncharacterized protein n=1 Tax=marine sediment metagenome TaxID=412755 RepID=A0A0F9XYR9_9ZZZZ